MKKNWIKGTIVLAILAIVTTSLGAAFAQPAGTAPEVASVRRQPDYEQLAAATYGRWTALGAHFAQLAGTASEVTAVRRQPDYEQLAAATYGRWTSLGAGFVQPKDTLDKLSAASMKR